MEVSLLCRPVKLWLILGHIAEVINSFDWTLRKRLPKGRQLQKFVLKWFVDAALSGPLEVCVRVCEREGETVGECL